MQEISARISLKSTKYNGEKIQSIFITYIISLKQFYNAHVVNIKWKINKHIYFLLLKQAFRAYVNYQSEKESLIVRSVFRFVYVKLSPKTPCLFMFPINYIINQIILIN